MKENKTIRITVNDGQYYPNDKEMLKEIIDNALKIPKIDGINKPFALILPYENYNIAKELYGMAYSLIKDNKYETIIIISPLHKIAFYGIALTKFEMFFTPFGNLEVDKEANAFLHKYDKDFIQYLDKYHSTEYAIETQLPFISIINDKIKILPVIIGESNTKFTILLSKAIIELIKNDIGKYLIIVTTNLSQTLKYDESVEMDNKFLNLLGLMNPDNLAEQLAMKQVQAFGGGGVVTLLRICEGLNKKNVKMLKYLNSYTINDDKYKTNGYFSACIW